MNVLAARVKIITPTPPRRYIQIYRSLFLPLRENTPGLGFRVGSAVLLVPLWEWRGQSAQPDWPRARVGGTGVNVLPHPERRGVKVPPTAGTARTSSGPAPTTNHSPARVPALLPPSLALPPTTPPPAPQWTPSSSTPASAPAPSAAADAQVPPSPSLPRAPR